MNKQRKVVITVTYNDLGVIVDAKAEELDSSAQPNHIAESGRKVSISCARENVIRCKDCKHRDKYGCCKYWKGLANGDIPIATDDYDFCSYAKRI